MKTPSRNVIHDIIDFVRIDLPKHLVLFRRWVRYYSAVWIVVIAGLLGLLAYFNLVTANKVVLGYAQLGSSYRVIAESYRSFFVANGLVMELAEVSHLSDSTAQLSRKSDPINASFVLSSGITGLDKKSYRSLGSVEFAPGWLFYRGADIEGPEPFTRLAGQRISIGPTGSFSNRAYKKLKSIAEAKVSKETILELPDQEGVTALIDGRIDAVWIVDSVSSQNVQAAAAAEGLKLYNWERADTFVERFEKLAKLRLPAGYFDITKNRPPRDVTLLGSPVSVLVEANLHPALQWALLLAARNYHATNFDDLSDGGVFPRHIDKEIPLTPVAERYFNTGVPVLFSYLPIYLASLLEAKWAWFLTVLIFVFPAYLWFRGFLARLERFELEQAHSEMDHDLEDLRKLEEKVGQARTRAELEDLARDLDALEQRELARAHTTEDASSHYVLRLAVVRVQESVTRAMEGLGDTVSSRKS